MCNLLIMLLLLALPIPEMPEPFKKELMNKIKKFKVPFLPASFLAGYFRSTYRDIQFSIAYPCPWVFCILYFVSLVRSEGVVLNFTIWTASIWIRLSVDINSILRSRVLCSLSCHLYQVVELDLPWDDSQVAKFGDAFKAWGEEEIEVALQAIQQAMPMNKLAYVVFSLYSPTILSVLPQLASARYYSSYVGKRLRVSQRLHYV